MAKVPAHLLRRRPHFFRPVPVRLRKGGWTVERQCAFLAELYFSGSVSAAAESVGLTRASAYKLRARADASSFARAWDSVLAKPGTGRLPPAKLNWQKLTLSAFINRVEAGLVQPVLYRGEMTAIRRKADDSGLLKLFRRTKQRRKRALLEEAKWDG